jgi:hypothetical protein
LTARFPRALVLALLGPLGVAMIGIAWVAVGERAGAAPFGGLVPRNSAEAAALGSASEFLRFLRRGEDPRRVYDVRTEVISSAIARATTLEAAMWSRQLEMIQLLDRLGDIPIGPERRALVCLAADLQVEDIVEYLAPGGISDCEVGAAIGRVVARMTGDGGDVE